MQKIIRSSSVKKVIDITLHNFYVDDCLVSVGSEEDAVSLYHKLCALCATGGFRLTKWLCNTCAVSAAIPQKKRTNDVKDLDWKSGTLPVERERRRKREIKVKILLRLLLFCNDIKNSLCKHLTNINSVDPVLLINKECILVTI